MSHLAEKIILALDANTANEAVAMAALFSNTGIKFKIGMELYFAEGPQIIEKIAKAGPVFLDLKLHDIPQTMARSISVLGKLGLWMVNVHASAGSDALKLVSETLNTQNQKPLLIGVTILTSLNSLNHLGSTKSPTELVTSLGMLCKDNGLDGIVCSANEVTEMKKVWPTGLCVTPGIRGKNDTHADQKRTATAKEALDFGSDYLVIGRPITQAASPLKALETIIEECSSQTKMS